MTSGHPAHKPAELFRADLISAMKIPDSMPMETGSYLTIRETWRTEWEIGVQVCVSPNHIPEPKARTIEDPPSQSEEFVLPSSAKLPESDNDDKQVMYDLDDLDLNWLESVNQKRKFRALAGSSGLSEDTLRAAILALETMCQQNMARAVATEETLGIEYDEQTVCDVCRDHESEESNEIIFCDMCNVCVHQACYGITTIPKGEWLCKACLAGEDEPECVLCPNRGGALKRVRPGNTNWAHLSCALWIPEIRVGNIDKMEPITSVDAVPPFRRNLVCYLCRRKYGACVQCSFPSCVMNYHVTCGFKQGLYMKTRLDMTSSGVIHESYCPKHSAMRRLPSWYNHLHSLSTSSPIKNDMIMSSRPSQLIEVQESFYKFTSPEELATDMKLSAKLSVLIYNYWKLKRRSQYNRPLLSHLPIESTLEGIKSELAASAVNMVGIDMDENFLKVVHLRQNLEKTRNLVYMVQRRERLKKQLLKNQAELLELKYKFLEETGSDELSGLDEETVKEEEMDEMVSIESSDDEPDSPYIRQTRSMTQKVSDSALPVPPSSDDDPPLHNHIGTGDNTLAPVVPLTNGPLTLQRVPSHQSSLHPPPKVVVIAAPHKREHKPFNNNSTPSSVGISRTLRNRESLSHLKKTTTSLLSLGDNGDVLKEENVMMNSQLKIKNSFSITESDSNTGAVVCTNHNGPSQQHRDILGSNSRTKMDGFVLRTGSAPNLRHRPYTISHKSS